MKKKKPPVVLASMLIVLIGAAIILFPKEQDPNAQPEAPKPDATPIGQSRQSPTKEQVAAKLAESPSKGRPTAPTEDPQSPAATLANATQPTIFIPKPATIGKQTPNDATVSAQWYRGNARASRKETKP
jgi:hypothetical protein